MGFWKKLFGAKQSPSPVVSPDRVASFHEAARGCDLEKVKAMVKDNPDLVSTKGQDAFGQTPLHLAALQGHRDLAQWLLDNKADVDARDKEGDTPLHKAAEVGCRDVVKLLLAKKADVKAKNNSGDTPLHRTASFGHKDIAELLLAKKTKVNARDNDGRTPLFKAALNGHKDVAELLVANKADIDARDKRGATPLDWALIKGHKEVAELLKPGGAKPKPQVLAGPQPPCKVMGCSQPKVPLSIFCEAHHQQNLSGMVFRLKDEKPHVSPGRSIACSKCGTSHVLVQHSFMMSPRQALAELSGSGTLVMQAGGVSREYMVGELHTFPAIAQANLRIQTIAAIAEAVEELKKGQDLTWICRKCGYDGNKFPVEWYGVKSQEGQQWPYPSDGFFREVSKKLVADHGIVVRVTDCGSLSAVRWRFTYKDGYEVVVGNPGWPVPTMKVDVDFFPGMVGSEGKTYARVFFAAAGLDTSGVDIFGMADGSTFEVRNGKFFKERSA